MIAEIISIGTEILLGDTVDSNAAEVGKVLASLGISHLHRQTVGDNLERIIKALKLALSRSDIVITIAGLGPTQDDLTREGIAEALGVPLIHDTEMERELLEIFKQYQLHWVESQLKQAQRPICAEKIPNPNGTAAGLICEHDQKLMIALPGPPSELIPMLYGGVKEKLVGRVSNHIIVSRVLRICGIGEGALEDKIKDLLASTNPTIAPYAKLGEVHLRLTIKSTSKREASRDIASMEEAIRARVGRYVYGVDECTLEETVKNLLENQNATIAFAESCTGGGLGARFTSIPGCSSVFLGSAVTYENAAKQKLLNVSSSTLEQYGAVSKECAFEMAMGAKALFSSDFALSVTGLAGPAGITPSQPLGKVFFGIATPEEIVTKEHHFLGSRENVRARSIQQALIELYRILLKKDLFQKQTAL